MPKTQPCLFDFSDPSIVKVGLISSRFSSNASAPPSGRS
uniref:Uncharacterized protein n=1 Tax=Steinernema glaseri TaxID=37863 RepID=A0A1I8AFS9_9BILA